MSPPLALADAGSAVGADAKAPAARMLLDSRALLAASMLLLNQVQADEHDVCLATFALVEQSAA